MSKLDEKTTWEAWLYPETEKDTQLFVIDGSGYGVIRNLCHRFPVGWEPRELDEFLDQRGYRRVDQSAHPRGNGWLMFLIERK